MKFQFRLQSVLTVRLHERDVEQQSLAVAKGLYLNLQAERQKLANERSDIMNELRAMNNSQSSFSPELVIVRQRYAEQLNIAISECDARIEEAARQIDLCLARLLAADQAVRSLEKLGERQRAEFQTQQEALFSCELDDAVNFKS